jgi:GWxTD domain-containing protein
MIDNIEKMSIRKFSKTIFLKYSLLVSLSFWFLFGCVSQKKIKSLKEQKNQATATLQETKHKPQVVAIKSRYLLKDSTSIKVFLEIDVENLQANDVVKQMKENFRFSWVLQPDYGVKERLNYGQINFTEQNCFLKDNQLNINFELAKPKNHTKVLLLTEIFELETNKKLTSDLILDFLGLRLNDRYGLFVEDMNTPLYRSYIKQDEVFQINSLMKNNKTLFLIHYEHEFEAAQSPMATSLRPAPKSLKIDEILTVKANTPLKLAKEGLYLAIEDTTNQKNGFCFMVVDNRFPKFTRPEKLTKPLIYMSTSLETKNINESSNAKQALDGYFLNITNGNQVLAKRIIKNYYQRIEEANQLFTAYKEGWKTDKGMIYIILGPPNKVQRSRDKEVWVYSQNTNFSEIIFTFNRKPNQFTDNYYELVRYPEYQAYWYPFVEAWRTGNVVE